MTIQQLEYALAVASEKHFVKAAEKCFVTQATLSMMIKKLEDELGVMIFDRSKHPVVPTEVGKKIIEQAQITVSEFNRIKQVISSERGEVSGELRIGIIPTLAPYLLPLFLNSFLNKYPNLKLKISEITTSEITSKLKSNELDAGVLAIPIHIPELNEQHLFYEDFVVYASEQDDMKKKYVLAGDIDVNRLWLLEEGHCLRSQVINLCELKLKETKMHQLDFNAGSLETLKKIVEANQGITILPKLALRDMTKQQLANIRYFKRPAPVREIGIITYRYFVKEQLIARLKNEILLSIPAEIRNVKAVSTVPIEI